MQLQTNENDEQLEALRSDRSPCVVSGLDRPYKHIPLGEQNRALKRQATMVILGNLGVLSTGMAVGLPTVTNSPLTDTTQGVYLTLSEFSWFASLNLFAAPFGGLLSGVLLDKFGRKNTMYVMNALALISWALMASASSENRESMFIQLVVSRVLVGISSGLSSAPVGVYSAEISTAKIRGRLILGTSIAVALGITLVYGLGYFIREDWRLISLICCAFQILTLLCVMPLPESPSWLISKSRLSEARKSINYFRGLDKKRILVKSLFTVKNVVLFTYLFLFFITAVITHPEILAEFNVLQKNIQLAEGEKKPSFFKSLMLPEVYKPLLVLMGLFAFQQLTGIFVIIVYAVQISAEAGVTIDPFMCAIMIGAARVFTTCPLGYIFEKWGRRRSGIISAIGMTISMTLLTLHEQPCLKIIPYLPVVAIVAYIVLSTVGLYTLPFFMISELFPQNVRGPASGLTVAFGTIVAFVCTKTYPSLKDVIGKEYCFAMYAFCSFLALIFIYLCLPETRGRSLMQIEEEFRHGKRSKNQMAPVELQEINIK